MHQPKIQLLLLFLLIYQANDAQLLKILKKAHDPAGIFSSKGSNPTSSIPLNPLEGIIPSPTEKLKDIIEDGKITKSEVESFSSATIGESFQITGNTIEVLSDNHQVLGELSLNALNLLSKIESCSAIDKKLNLRLLKSIGLPISDNDLKSLETYLDKEKIALEELIQLRQKALEVDKSVGKISSETLKYLGKYFILSSNGFPKKEKSDVKYDREPSIAGVEIPLSSLDKILNQLLLNNQQKVKEEDSNLEIITPGTSDIIYNLENNTFELKIQDIKLKMTQAGLKVLTLSIKEMQLQLVPIKDTSGVLSLKPILYYLDIKNSPPIIDKSIAWQLTDLFLPTANMDIDLNTPLELPLEIENASLDHLLLNTENFTQQLFIDEKGLGVSFIDSTVSPMLFESNSISINFTDYFFKSMLKEALITSDELKINISKKIKRYDEGYSHIFIKDINDLKMNKDGNIYFDLKLTVHLRRFLGIRPQINLPFNHFGFHLTPIIDTEADKISFHMKPVIDSIEVKGKQYKTWMLKKALRLMNQSKLTIKTSKSDLKEFENLNYLDSKGYPILPIERELNINRTEGLWQIQFNFNK
ncbi:MAG: hypothetical protein N4A35_16910 [Flavobacteriales bacterium]|jgi:hypothetical protein|nr:hypothetical protein [Flavobacteriales bacterium]